MRPLPALVLLVPGPVLAHIPDGDVTSIGSVGHQLTSLHHLPGMLLLVAWATLLVLALRRNRSGR